MEALLNKKKERITLYCAVLKVTITYIAQNNKIIIPYIKVYGVVLKLYYFTTLLPLWFSNTA